MGFPKIPDNSPFAGGGLSEDVNDVSCFTSFLGDDLFTSVFSSSLFAYSLASSARCFS